MDKGVQEAQVAGQEGHGAVAGAGAGTRRKPCGRRPGACADPVKVAEAFAAFLRGRLPWLPSLFARLPDFRRPDRYRYGL